MDNSPARLSCCRWARKRRIPAVFTMLSADGMRIHCFLQGPKSSGLQIAIGRPTNVFCEVDEGPQYMFAGSTVTGVDEETAQAYSAVADNGRPANMVQLRRLGDLVRRKYLDEGFLDYRMDVGKTRLSAATGAFGAGRSRSALHDRRSGSPSRASRSLGPARPERAAVFKVGGMFHLKKAGLSWESLTLQKDFWDGTVDITVDPGKEGAGTQ